MAVLGPGLSDSFTIDPATEQLVLEEVAVSGAPATIIRCWAYPLGNIVPVEEDGGVQQAARVLKNEIDVTTHTIAVTRREFTVDPDVGGVVYGDPAEVLLEPI